VQALSGINVPQAHGLVEAAGQSSPAIGGKGDAAEAARRIPMKEPKVFVARGRVLKLLRQEVQKLEQG
jgi:hypothetical protein